MVLGICDGRLRGVTSAAQEYRNGAACVPRRERDTPCGLVRWRGTHDTSRSVPEHSFRRQLAPRRTRGMQRQKAIDQLAGVTGEQPPRGFQRVADIRVENARNPLRFAARDQILAALRGELHDLDMLMPADAAPGIIRITNAISTFEHARSELR